MELYRAMLMMEREQQSAAVIPDNYTYRFVLKACAYLFSLSEGKQTWHTRCSRKCPREVRFHGTS
ncbi:hypothetical protein HN873_045374 [Arachis hypogaea]